MEPQADAIVDIAESQVHYFGVPGKMLLPSSATVAAVIKRIPAHQLLTTDLLRKQLAAQFNIQRTCPVITKKALQTIANGAADNLPYWRVIKQSGELNAIFPGGAESPPPRLRSYPRSTVPAWFGHNHYRPVCDRS